MWSHPATALHGLPLVARPRAGLLASPARGTSPMTFSLPKTSPLRARLPLGGTGTTAGNRSSRLRGTPDRSSRLHRWSGQAKTRNDKIRKSGFSLPKFDFLRSQNFQNSYFPNSKKYFQIDLSRSVGGRCGPDSGFEHPVALPSGAASHIPIPRGLSRPHGPRPTPHHFFPIFS